MRYIRCDRCGREDTLVGVAIDDMFGDCKTFYSVDKYDLCIDCWAAFRAFMNDPEALPADPMQTRIEQFDAEGDATVTGEAGIEDPGVIEGVAL